MTPLELLRAGGTIGELPVSYRVLSLISLEVQKDLRRFKKYKGVRLKCCGLDDFWKLKTEIWIDIERKKSMQIHTFGSIQHLGLFRITWLIGQKLRLVEFAGLKEKIDIDVLNRFNLYLNKPVTKEFLRRSGFLNDVNFI